MIVGETMTARADVPSRRATLDDLFRRAAVHNPDAIALVDPADRAWFTGGEPKAVTFAEADRIVWALAARLRRLGLQTDAVIAVQLPNTVESVLALLGILRAGMIAAPLPMLWRPTEIIAALSGTGAKAFLTTARIGETQHCDVAMSAAAQLFSIRHVCAFGHGLPDGVTPLDDVMAPAGREALPAVSRSDNPAAHAAVITFEPTPRGILPALRNHAQLVAGGLNVYASAGMAADATLLSATPLASFAGLCVSLMPWLLSGGRLVLQQPFDPATFVAAMQDHYCGTAVIPGPLVGGLEDADLFASEGLQSVIAIWRAPERADAAPPWRGRQRLVDVQAFGEVGLIARPRQPGGTIAPMMVGRTGETDTVEFKRTAGGTLALRGAMVASTETVPPSPNDGFADTHYPCIVERDYFRVTGPQPGMIGIGGYRVARADVDAMAHALPGDSLVTALPDELLGQRLKGRAVDRDAAAALIAARGVNPLIDGAFGRHRDAA
jgi:acyl-CoA synthetase (AMP-forming)/AMP-acid ligase II